ncbi:unnamed protein product [Mytilus coruscus]|uniref:SGNH domain-containing protein n=1 Tax=Mytilus coruscus TaxID=42192 RepID=A0A6J8C1L6_MYTCO|nr:unnamed protein product [Mytilus coruscus]
MSRGNSKKGTSARGQGFKRRRMNEPKEKEPISEINHRSSTIKNQGQSNESRVGFSSQSESLHSFRQSSDQQNFQPPRTCNAIKVFAPDIKIIWSDILPRAYWHGTLMPKIVEIARKRVNCAERKFMKKEGQYILRYPAIKASESNLFRHDGTHLSQVGIGIFLNNIQAAIETFILGVAKVFPQDK